MNSADQQQARHHAGQEQAADGGFGGDAIHDHGDRWRDQDAQRAARRDGACCNAVGVAALAHLRNAHLADGRTGGRRRAGHGGKQRAGAEIGDHQPAGHPGQPAVKCFIKVGTGAGGGNGRAHDDEHRDRQQGKVVELAEQDFRQQLQRAQRRRTPCRKPAETMSRPTATIRRRTGQDGDDGQSSAPSVSGSISRFSSAMLKGLSVPLMAAAEVGMQLQQQHAEADRHAR